LENERSFCFRAGNGFQPEVFLCVFASVDFLRISTVTQCFLCRTKLQEARRRKEALRIQRPGTGLDDNANYGAWWEDLR